MAVPRPLHLSSSSSSGSEHLPQPPSKLIKTIAIEMLSLENERCGGLCDLTLVSGMEKLDRCKLRPPVFVFGAFPKVVRGSSTTKECLYLDMV